MLDSGVAYECPTTWHAGLFSVDDLPALADTLVDAGVAHWALTAGQVERLRALFAGFVVLAGQQAPLGSECERLLKADNSRSHIGEAVTTLLSSRRSRGRFSKQSDCT